MNWSRDLKTSPTLWFAPIWIALLLPRIDLALSQAFYDSSAGFTWARSGAFEFIRALGPDIIIGSLVLCIALYLMSLLSSRWIWRITPKRIVYLGLTLLIGPGLIVETLLKPHWGRARPREVSAFGGAMEYTPAWQPANQCDGNCSFVSGHAAVAFWLTAYAFILPPRWRAPMICLGIVLGFAMGFVRVAQGAHFISDVATAGFLVLLVNEVLARRMFQPVTL